MKLYRILAIVRRHSLLTFSQFDRLFNILYWPFLNIVLWGITSTWLQKQTSQPHLVTMILTGLILWQIVFRVNLETAKGLFEEVLSHNLVNLFSTPLSLAEWVAAMAIMGVVNMFLITLCCSAILWLLYGINIFMLGWSLIPFMLSLLMSGLTIGFFICGLLINWGLKAQDFIFSIGWIFAPFSAIYYPLDVLPPIVQAVGRLLPTTYIFEAMRALLQKGSFPPHYMLLSFFLNILYLTASLVFFWYMFEQSKEKGLKRLE